MWSFLQKLTNRRTPRPPLIVRRIDSCDGRHRLTICQRADHFTWDTDVLTEPDELERQYAAEPYWAPGWEGGIFATADAAEADASKTLPWLKEEREKRDDA